MAGSDPARSAGNLPAGRTSFVGRRREAAAVKRLLRRHRLVTLTGGAGVGKTRLALRVAAQLRTEFTDGVLLVELAPLEDDTFLTLAVARALGVRENPERPLRETLAAFLVDRNLLLVLDNCEHLVDGCARLADDLLRASSTLHILATSQQVLHALGERLFEVPPLPVPETHGPAAAHNEAVRLFAERAATALPGFALGADNRATVARLCQRLEGIPLAIELAAARVRAMPVEAILARLEDYSCEPLGAWAPRGGARLLAMLTAIDWSFGLCSAQEQRLWARASVFSGDFDLDAAERVCSGDGIASGDVLELIAGLLDKSVLIRSLGAHTARYRMLETIREYGAQRLATAGEVAAVRTRHREYFGALARRAEQALLGPGELAAFTRLGCEHANLRTALEYCLAEPAQARAGLEIAGSLVYYWAIAGHHREGRFWLGRALDADPEPSPARAKALWVNSWLAILLADWDEARSLIDQCCAVANQLGDEAARAHATRLVGNLELFHGDLGRAATLLQDVLARLRELGDRAGVWMTLRHLSLTTAQLGDADGARRFGEQCVNLADALGAPMTRAWSLAIHGVAQWLAGNHHLASQLAREGLRVSPLLIDRWVVANCLEVLAWDAAARHDLKRAARLLGAAHLVWRLTAIPTSRRHLATEHARCKQRARTTLGDQAFGRLFDEGTRLTVDQTIAYALGETP
jgi:predicted ATPase